MSDSNDQSEKDHSDNDDTMDRQEPSTSEIKDDKKKDKRKKPKQSGIVYLPTVPEGLTATRLRDLFSPYGKIGRIYLAPETFTSSKGKKVKRFSEGWVEFADKRLAKRVAASLNNQPIGGRRKSKLAEVLWTLKYLHRFKWTHLTEQLKYEKAVHQQRMRAEVTLAKKQANFFAHNIEKGKMLRELEERVLKKGGKWEQYQRQIHQKTPAQPKQPNKQQTDAILAEIFAE